MRILPTTLLAASCLTAPTAAWATDPTITDKARGVFERAYPDLCDQGINTEWLSAMEPITEIVTLPPAYEGGEEEALYLYGFGCSSGAYNLQTVWFVADIYGTFEPLAFAHPDAEYDYADDDSAVLASHHITGWTAGVTVTGASYDPETRTLTSNAKWRGLGDARATGEWVLGHEGFTLRRYRVDPTFDGEVDGFVTLYDAGG